jgi:hypothetical protein
MYCSIDLVRQPEAKATLLRGVMAQGGFEVLSKWLRSGMLELQRDAFAIVHGFVHPQG